jgi:hypothetical protein
MDIVRCLHYVVEYKEQIVWHYGSWVFLKLLNSRVFKNITLPKSSWWLHTACLKRSLDIKNALSLKQKKLNIQGSTVHTSLQGDSHFHSFNQSLLNSHHVYIVFVIFGTLRTTLDGHKSYWPCSYQVCYNYF